MIYTYAARWLPVNDAVAFGAATDPGRWHRWLSVAEVDPDTRAAPLDRPGRATRGALRLNGRHEVTWRVARVLRHIVTLEAVTDDERVLARLTMCFSAWHGGTAAELRLEAPDRLTPPMLRRGLARSLRELEGLLPAPPSTPAIAPVAALGEVVRRSGRARNAPVREVEGTLV